MRVSGGGVEWGGMDHLGKQAHGDCVPWKEKGQVE